MRVATGLARPGLRFGCITLAALSDTVLPGLAEGRQLTGRHTAEDIAAFYLERGAQQVVAKLGPEGAYYAQRGGASGIGPGLCVERVVQLPGDADGLPTRAELG